MAATIHFFVHTNFAADAWSTENNIPKLLAYYDAVISAIRSHDGPTIATIMPPYSILNGTADPANRAAHDKFLQDLAATKATICQEDQRSHPHIPLGTPAYPLIDELLLSGAADTIAFAGGYFQGCLRETWQNFSQAYGSYCTENGIKAVAMPHLILVAGPSPATLAEQTGNQATPLDTYIGFQGII